MNKSAHEMLEKIGYKFVSYGDNELIEYDKEIVKDGEYKIIVFNIKNKFFWTTYFKNIYDEAGVLIRKEYLINSLDITELQAINKQIEELGWLDD